MLCGFDGASALLLSQGGNTARTRASWSLLGTPPKVRSSVDWPRLVMGVVCWACQVGTPRIRLPGVVIAGSPWKRGISAVCFPGISETLTIQCRLHFDGHTICATACLTRTCNLKVTHFWGRIRREECLLRDPLRSPFSVVRRVQLHLLCCGLLGSMELWDRDKLRSLSCT